MANNFTESNRVIYKITQPSGEVVTRLGIIENVWKFRKRPREYDIIGEDGRHHIRIPVDDMAARLYIDSDLTEKLADKIQSNLKLKYEANLSNDIIYEIEAKSII